MGAVDPGNVHPQKYESPDQGVVIGGLGGKRHHDPGNPARGTGTKESVRIVVEGGTTLFKALDCRTKAGCRTVERGTDALDGSQNVSLASAERREATFSQPALEVTDITSTEREIVHQVDRIEKMGRIDRDDVRLVMGLHLAHEVFQSDKFSPDRRPVDLPDDD
jgi:hypothetical protein